MTRLWAGYAVFPRRDQRCRNSHFESQVIRSYFFSWSFTEIQSAIVFTLVGNGLGFDGFSVFGINLTEIRRYAKPNSATLPRERVKLWTITGNLSIGDLIQRTD